VVAITLERMVIELVAHFGWVELANADPDPVLRKRSEHQVDA
jgi:uncharacterized protein (DUF2132 family)